MLVLLELRAKMLLRFLLLILFQVFPSWSSRPPRLNVSDEMVILTKEQNYFSLRCEGSERLKWNWTTELEAESEYLSISHTEHENTDYPYVSTFTVFEPEVFDTGFYHCHYDDEMDTTRNHYKASTYVFVHDGDRSFVIDHDFKAKQITTADKLVIDCRTTLPNMDVKLTKDEIDISSLAKWHPQIGFTLHNLAIQDSGLYTCESLSEGDSLSVFVQISPAFHELPRPAIYTESNQHFVKGYSFTLNCTMIQHTDVIFRWIYPNSGARYVSNSAVFESGGSKYDLNTLVVHNASEADSGTYTCSVTAQGFRPNSESMNITIKDSMKSYINMSGVKEIGIAENGFLKWKVDVTTFPPDPILIYRNWEGKEVKETSRITTEHHSQSAISWLRINPITADDFGNYTLTGITSDHLAKDSATVQIRVISGPSPTVKGVPSFLSQGDRVEAFCEVKGFPVPSVSWTFQPCSDGHDSCSSTLESTQIESGSMDILPPGNINKATVEFNPPTSGLLWCTGRNNISTSNTKASVIITDIGGTFILHHIGQNITSEVLGSRKTIDVVMNDDFRLICGASKFNFTRVQLKSHSNFQVHEKESKFSWIKNIMAEKVTIGHQGEYTCLAEPHGNQSSQTKTIFIKVLEEQPVKFNEDANLREGGHEVFVKEISPFSLNCAVSGTPAPIIKWYKDNQPLTLDSDFFNEETVVLSSDHQTLKLKHVQREKHVGTYSCIAENRLRKLVGFLTLTVPKAGLSTGTKVGLSLAFVGIAFLVSIVVFLVKRVKTERQFRKSFRKNELYLFEKGNVGQLNPDCTAEEQAELLPYSQEWEVSRDSITIGKQLGSGAFGRVVKATVKGLEGPATTTVAIKMCKSQADPSQVRALSLELKIMIHLGKHLNIVNLMGANTVHIGKGELWILVEFCRFGNLLMFMHRHRRTFINQVDPVTGLIDHFKTTVDPYSPLSPLAMSTSGGFQVAPVVNQDGYLSPKTTEFTLAAPPLGSRAGSSLASCTSPTTASPRNSHPAGPLMQQVNNPLYSAGLDRSVSGNAEESGTSNSEESHSSHPLATRLQSVSSTTSSHSVGYRRNDFKALNSDMSTLQTSCPPFSPSPLSPTDSSRMSEVGLDSHGNPFVYEVGSVPGVNAPFSTSDLICWAWQVAQGMEYLARRNVLHGDLAARNLLLADANVVKISDFGLSREMYKKDIYMKKGDDLMPVKWISVEAIRDRIFSVQSDVWAYGVTLWELFSLGSTPYPGIEVNKDFLQLLEGGYRMDRPKYANQEIYNLLLQCWQAEPMERPSFSEAAERLGVMLLPDLKGEYMTMNDHYLKMNEERFKEETDYLNMLTSPDFDSVTRGGEEQYVNIEESVDGANPSNYVKMTSTGLASYSRVGNPSSLPTDSDKGHYLAMESAQGSPSPMTDVFSPRPDEASRLRL